MSKAAVAICIGQKDKAVASSPTPILTTRVKINTCLDIIFSNFTDQNDCKARRKITGRMIIDDNQNGNLSEKTILLVKKTIIKVMTRPLV